MVRRRKESQKSYLQNCQDGPAPYIVVCTLSSTWLLCTAHAYTHTQCIATMYYSLHSIEMSRRKRNTRLHIQFVPRVGSCIMYARMAGWQPRDWLVYARAGVYCHQAPGRARRPRELAEEAREGGRSKSQLRLVSTVSPVYSTRSNMHFDMT